MLSNNDILTVLGISKILFEQKTFNYFICLLIYHEQLISFHFSLGEVPLQKEERATESNLPSLRDFSWNMELQQT